MRLIDAESIPYVKSEDGVLNDYAFRYDINNLPAYTDAEPATHAEWEYYSGFMINSHYRCSNCHTPRYEHYAINEFKYCPSCGAKMDGEPKICHL